MTEKSSIIERSFALACVSVMSLITLLVGWFNPATTVPFQVCPFFIATGLACPGCGLTRSLHAFLHGEILTALDHNLLLPAILFFFGYLYVSLFLLLLRGRGLDFRIFTPLVIWSFFAFALVFTVLRNLPSYPFTWLAP